MAIFAGYEDAKAIRRTIKDTRNLIARTRAQKHHRSLLPATLSFIQFRITAAAVVSANKWKYTGTQVRPKTANAGLYEDVPGGIVSTNIYNRLEVNNASTGIQGNGVQVGTFPKFTVALFPIRGGGLGPIYECIGVKLDSGTTEYWFTGSNAINVTCV